MAGEQSRPLQAGVLLLTAQIFADESGESDSLSLLKSRLPFGVALIPIDDGIVRFEGPWWKVPRCPTCRVDPRRPDRNELFYVQNARVGLVKCWRCGHFCNVSRHKRSHHSKDAIEERRKKAELDSRPRAEEESAK